jgi:hypothetical protein
MTSLVVECLRCGTSRIARRDVFKHFEAPECPHCGYLGWTPILELTEPERRKPPHEQKHEQHLTSVA